MNARQLRATMGKKLIGRRIVTARMGEYSGGVATVIDLGHDKNAPEIVMNVRKRGCPCMGIFEYERVRLIEDKV